MAEIHQEGDFVLLETGTKKVLGPDSYEGVIGNVKLKLLEDLLTLSYAGKKDISINVSKSGTVDIESKDPTYEGKQFAIYNEVSVRLREVLSSHVQLARINKNNYQVNHKEDKQDGINVTNEEPVNQ